MSHIVLVVGQDTDPSSWSRARKRRGSGWITPDYRFFWMVASGEGFEASSWSQARSRWGFGLDNAGL